MQTQKPFFHSCASQQLDGKLAACPGEFVGIVATVVEANLEWSDLGSFQALGSVVPRDADGNVTALHRGARALLQQAQDCTVYADGKRAVVLLGVRNLAVVAMNDALLVCPMDRIDELKDLVKRLPEAGFGDLV